jgi:hypothetical protein
MPVSDYFKDSLQIRRAFITKSASGSSVTEWYPLYHYQASTISFTADHTISDSANGFLTAGFIAGQTITVYDAGGFNRVTVVIDSISSGVITTTSTSPHVITKNAVQSGLVKIDCAQTIVGFINESAGGKQFTIGQNVVTSTGVAFISIDYDSWNITEKDKIYCTDNAKEYQLLYVKPVNKSLIDKINWISIDIRNVS